MSQHSTSVQVTFEEHTTLTDWLATQLADYRYLLAHTERGVVWGRVDHQGGTARLHTSTDVFGTRAGTGRLHLPELHELRLFGSTGELHLWRDDRGWWATTTSDDTAGTYLEEKQILWGTEALERQDDFTLLKDGSQGLVHAVPCDVDPKSFRKDQPRPLRLVMRHYLTADENSALRISHSRLVDLEVV